MKSEEMKYFKELTKDRSESADTLDKPSMRGARDNVVDKYSDQAHFIYELLQNADDVGAKEAYFELKNKELVFSHNGEKHFSISNPETEEKDKKNGELGDINAICSVGQSNKGNDVTIGKFGVGFKAVFQYTTTPRIYDKNFQFKIERLFVPQIIEDDLAIHKDNNFTYFVFPFDRKDITQKFAFTDISEKLESLTYPLLFLNNLTAIMCEYNGESVIYDKTISKQITFGKTTADKVVMTVTRGNKTSKTSLWLFSRKLKNGLKYSVGYVLDSKGAIKAVDRGAFCYFPTKEYTGLKFIVHAPFLLTSSRETVKANDAHNIDMVDKLSDLGRDSIIYLRDIGIQERKLLVDDDFFLNIIPKPKRKSIYYWEEDEESEKDKLSFEPFAIKIQEMLHSETIFPCADNATYASAENAYWGRDDKFFGTFSDEQLGVLVNNKKAKWIFQGNHNWNDQNNTNRLFYDYIYEILGRDHRLDDNDILKNKNLEKLIKLENIDWLHQLYKFANKTKANKETSKYIPIFLDEDGNTASLLDDNNVEILFLPSEIKNLRAIHTLILSNKETKKFLDDLGIKSPSNIDRVKNGILKNYTEEDDYGNNEDFEKIFKIYNELEVDEQKELVEEIKKSNFKIQVKDVKDKKSTFNNPEKVYFRTPELEKYFSTSDYSPFVDSSILTGKTKEKKLFLERLGTNTLPRVYERRIYWSDACLIRKDWKNHNYYKFLEYCIEGMDEAIENVEKKHDIEKSVLIWKILEKIISEKNIKHLADVFTGKYVWLSQGEFKTDSTFESTCFYKLKNKKWILLKDGKWVAPSSTTLDKLANDYSFSSYESKILIKSLGIGDSRFNAEEISQMKFAAEVARMGFSPEQALEELRKISEKQSQEKYIDNPETNEKKHVVTQETTTFECDITVNKESFILETDKSHKEVYEKIEKERKKLEKKHAESQNSYEIDEEEIAEDEVFIPSENTAKKIEKRNQELAEEIDKIEREQRLTENIAKSKKYSYGWISNLIEKELLLTDSYEGRKKSLKACFSAVEKEQGSTRTLILKNPIGNIPQDIENHNDIPMTFTFDNGDTKDIVVDVFSIYSYTVRAKLKNVEQISGIDLNSVREISIRLEKAGFLLEELCARYKEFKFEDKYSFLDNLTNKIDFVFGPPGTGKTTYLCKDIIIPIMNKCNEKKILVLGPTNKSADVIVNKIIELSKEDETYEDWLVRFGSTNDENIDKLPIYKDKHVDLDEYGDCTLVTTIHRFWYDFMIPTEGQGTNLRDVDWDYIVIDEASMIPLVHILYPLYKKFPEKFVIAGDPFQIEPVITAEEWKDENIYSLVNLNEFKENPATRPHKYNTKLLTTQYRSIPCIGRVFSNLTYNGVLKHNRSEMDRKKIDFDGEKYSSISLIRYPVSKYESIYASKYLGRKSAYHVYSALLAYEFAKHLSEKINKGDNEHVSIGLISPYRAQADIIEKMCRNIPNSEKVSIQVGTIHGFQGDECDIVICVFNAPPGELTSDRLSINKKNIINVAISRARDYLFIVVPEDESRGFKNLHTLDNLLGIVRKERSHSEITSYALEQTMFDDDKYLEKSTFSTSHQNVNVYEQPEKKYEIRAEESALDIQVHVNENSKETKRQVQLQLSEQKDEVIPNNIKTNEVQKKIYEYATDSYNMQLYLENDVKHVFRDRKYDVIPDRENKLKVTYTNEKYSLRNIDLFKLENRNKDGRAYVYVKGNILASAEFSNKYVYNYSRSKKEFWFSVDHKKLPDVFDAFAVIEKRTNITDEELINKLHAIRND